ncbi:MAG: RAMP superfamily CRISPR-associated protein [Pseudomonadota bacterium]
MNNLLKRYYKRKAIHLDCRIVTPMFLGNADQQAEWRAAPFKGLLRYWWRVTQYDLGQPGKNGVLKLLEAESRLFGFAGVSGSSEGGKSCVGVAVSGNGKPVKNKMPSLDPIRHPETNNPDVNPLLYLANMGLMKPGGEVLHSYFLPGSDFSWTISLPAEDAAQIKATLALIRAFGAIGGRCRNGWGSFQIARMEGINMDEAETVRVLDSLTREWTDGLDRDYPNCLGRDRDGPLLWKTPTADTAGDVMRALADTYVGVRSRDLGPGLGRLDPGGPDFPSERHLLGFPLTHHPARQQAKWGNSARHASPLRFIVRRKDHGYTGFILHLPHMHSSQMELPEVNQTKVWEKVHAKLDRLLKRAEYGECL